MSTPRYRRDVDGLRAVAVTAVVLFHAGLWPFRSGFVGVDVFFVISGFLIGGIIFRDSNAHRFRFATFYARRARRILPALLVVIFSTLCFGLLILSPGELSKAAVSAVSALVGASNIRFWLGTNYFSPDARLDPFLMTWSLGVEEQFYILFPFVLIALRRLPRKIQMASLFAISVVSFVISIILTAKVPVAAFYILPSRAWELGAGALLAIQLDRVEGRPSTKLQQGLGVFGLVVVFVSLVAFSERTPFPGIAAALPVIGTVALLAAEHSWVNRTLLSNRVAVGIGLISYSWYLWHWPLLASAKICSVSPPSPVVVVAVVALSLILAVASWRFVEQPFRHAARSDRDTLVRYAALLVVMLLFPVALKIAHGLPQRTGPTVAHIEAVVAAGRGDRCLAPYGQATLNRAADCAPPEPGLKIALLGDSHAAALAAGLRELANAHGYALEQFTKSSCPPLQGVTRASPSHPGHAAECGRYNTAAQSEVLRDPSVKQVYLAAFWSAPTEPGANDAYVDVQAGGGKAPLQSAELSLGLRRAVETFVAAGKRVVIVGDVPRLSFDAAKEALAEAMPGRRAAERLLDPVFRTHGGVADHSQILNPDNAITETVRRIADGDAGVSYFSTRANLCTHSGCRYSIDGQPLYFDSQHLSLLGSRLALAGLALK